MYIPVHRTNPTKAFVSVIRGVKNADVVTYCQSKLKANDPSPSFPLDPPKMFVKTKLSRFARQKKLTPVKTGMTY